jgi:hypothetical protein
VLVDEQFANRAECVERANAHSKQQYDMHVQFNADGALVL